MSSILSKNINTAREDAAKSGGEAETALADALFRISSRLAAVGLAVFQESREREKKRFYTCIGLLYTTRRQNMSTRIEMEHIGRNGVHYKYPFSIEAVRKYWKNGHRIQLYLIREDPNAVNGGSVTTVTCNHFGDDPVPHLSVWCAPRMNQPYPFYHRIDGIHVHYRRDGKINTWGC